MSFADGVRAWAERTKAGTEEIFQNIALAMLRRVVLRSPVGNPELWAANAHALAQRASYNRDVDRTNVILDADPILREQLKLKSGGRLKRPRRLSARTLAKRIPLQAGKDYVGGRFRGAWIVTRGSPASGVPHRIDPNGGETIAIGATVIQSAKLGETIYLVNNLPYAQRLEDGWSKQAPVGMVRITVAELQGIAEVAVRSL